MEQRVRLGLGGQGSPRLWDPCEGWPLFGNVHGACFLGAVWLCTPKVPVGTQGHSSPRMPRPLSRCSWTPTSWRWAQSWTCPAGLLPQVCSRGSTTHRTWPGPSSPAQVRPRATEPLLCAKRTSTLSPRCPVPAPGPRWALQSSPPVQASARGAGAGPLASPWGPLFPPPFLLLGQQPQDGFSGCHSQAHAGLAPPEMQQPQGPRATQDQQGG